MAETVSPVNKAEELAAAAWKRVERLPCRLTIEVPIASFQVADLVQLAPGRVLGTPLNAGQDVPLRINGELIAWAEFEALRDCLAVRLTELV